MREETVVGLHKRCEMPTLLDRRKEFLSSLMFRKSKKIIRVNAVRQTRQAASFNFPLKRPRSDFYIKSPYYRGVKIWDTIDKEIQLSLSKETFKKHVKLKFDTFMKGKKLEYVNSREYINIQRRIRARNDVLVNVVP